MSKKPKIVEVVECPNCKEQNHILLKLSEKPKIEIVSCVHCKIRMEVAYETSVNVEVAPMREHLRRSSGADVLSKFKAIAGGKLDSRWPPVPRAIGATWCRSSLINEGE